MAGPVMNVESRIAEILAAEAEAIRRIQVDQTYAVAWI